MNQVFYHSCETMAELPDKSVHCCVTSPPYYGLRDYGVDGQIGLEPTIAEYIERMVAVFREVKRVLRDDGTLWLNIGDSYCANPKGPGGDDKSTLSRSGVSYQREAPANRRTTGEGLKSKDLIGMPWRIAFALQEDGWYLRCDIVWSKPNPMPESIQDRPTRSHEYVFLMSKSPRYYYDIDAIREPLSDTTMERLQNKGFWQQTGGAKDYANGEGGDQSRSMRRAVENLRVKTIDNPHYAGRRQCPEPGEDGAFHESVLALIPTDDSPELFDPPWNSPGKNSRVFVDRDPAHLNKPNGRNRRSVWEIATYAYSQAHFATFPPDLIAPCILAGAPQTACAICGSPWLRETEIEYTQSVRHGEGSIVGRRDDGNGRGDNGLPRLEKQITTTSPSCTCDGPSTPGLVLDPFMGSGTTAMVAESLGRQWVGYEINEQYRTLIEQRTRQQGLFAQEPAS